MHKPCHSNFFVDIYINNCFTKFYCIKEHFTMICHDFECTVCQYKFEELLSKDEPYPKCPKCNGETEKCLGNTPSFHSPKYWELNRKARLMRNKMTGKTPWRKSSESQTD